MISTRGAGVFMVLWKIKMSSITMISAKLLVLLINGNTNTNHGKE
jgi:hypothetical protein